MGYGNPFSIDRWDTVSHPAIIASDKTYRTTIAGQKVTFNPTNLLVAELLRQELAIRVVTGSRPALRKASTNLGLATPALPGARACTKPELDP